MRSGVLLVDKPAGITSAHAIRKLEKRFRLEKVGHGGTLDPFATGLLVVLVGEATKVARFLLLGRKGYEAKARTGWETETGDLEGAKIGTGAAPNAPESSWKDSLPAFLGKTMQAPPRYSAVKVKGRKLYEYARAGEEMDAAAREIEIYELELARWEPEAARIRLECSGGTYVRVLAQDWARAAGTRAHLEELRRYRVGDFRVDRASPLDDLLALPSDTALPLVPITEALAHLPQIRCAAADAARVRAGDQSRIPDLLASSPGGLSIVAAEHVLLVTDASGAAEPLALLARAEAGFKLDRVFR